LSFNAPAPTYTSTLSLHDALPIFARLMRLMSKVNRTVTAASAAPEREPDITERARRAAVCHGFDLPCATWVAKYSRQSRRSSKLFSVKNVGLPSPVANFPR